MARTLICLFFLCCGAVSLQAQVAVRPADVAEASRAFDSRTRSNTLKCSAHSWGPNLDFNFNYETGYLLTADMAQFAIGEETVSYVKITPDGKEPMFLHENLVVPSLTWDAARGLSATNLKHFDISTSGAFSVGEGGYSVEFLLADHRGRSCYAHWKVHTGKYASKAGPPAMQPETAAELAPIMWDGELREKGLRLRILMDAAPFDPRATQLHAWDRAILLQSLVSLLQHLPCESVQLMAFNLDKQQVVFSSDYFTADDFPNLRKSLQRMELSTVSYKALRRGSAPDFLLQLAQDPTSTDPPPDAVVFLGPDMRAHENPKIEELESGGPRFFYLEFYPPGGHFPDTIENLTKNLHGSVFFIYSTNDLASAIQKMLTQFKTIGEEAEDSHKEP